MSAPAAVEFDLAIRSVILIDAPAQDVWRWLARLQDWKPSVVSLERLAGEPDAEGETLRIGQRPGDTTAHVLMRTVRSQPHEWKLQTLRAEDGDTMDGYVSYTLTDGQGGTQLGCAVSARCRMPLPPGVGSARDFERLANASTLAKLEADLVRLKQRVEHGRER
ncbi:MAG: hypothetical protein FGM43_00100 [Sinobacteraceae bacterium]|nr:hypothetical protein [Nevskiaceae bacterium]